MLYYVEIKCSHRPWRKNFLPNSFVLVFVVGKGRLCGIVYPQIIKEFCEGSDAGTRIGRWTGMWKWKMKGNTEEEKCKKVIGYTAELETVR